MRSDIFVAAYCHARHRALFSLWDTICAPGQGALNVPNACTGLTMKWLFLVIFPIIIAVILLMGKLAPGALAAVPMRVSPGIMFGAAALTVAATFLSLWRRGVR